MYLSWFVVICVIAYYNWYAAIMLYLIVGEYIAIVALRPKRAVKRPTRLAVFILILLWSVPMIIKTFK